MDRGVSICRRCTIGPPILYVASPGEIIPLRIFDCVTMFEVLLHRTSVKGAYTHCIDA